MLTRQDLRPVWAEINLNNLKNNISEVRRVVKKDTLICAVIKADGYGHGAVEIASTLLANGADRLAVATLTEAIQLRKAGIDTSLMVLGYTPEEQAQLVINYDIIQTVYTLQQAKAFSEAATLNNKSVKLHLKIDTGMSRLGFDTTDKTIKEIGEIVLMPNLVVEGIYTHFAMADEKDKTFTHQQFNRFTELTHKLEKEDINIPIKHVSNSAAIIDLPEMNLDMVRAGIMLYGLYPSKDVNHNQVKLKQVMTLKARVSHVKKLPADCGISYGLIYKTEEERKIITLPIGYADGFTRLLTGKATVSIKGEKIPVVGRICMDQSMADATGIEVERGDEVILFGETSDIADTVDDFAAKLGTINYEIVCMIGKRVPRVYLENNKLLHIRDTLLE
ncbi:alanine racemase [Alkaliphilus peptidifermentans]|uniref:Alanine racemase n=1 Tax=Alkaliphilus peptidifermentans DSM 18978 TaxID=1120976 RepID=A0A1G5GCT4_9FIRM|nr:alanine racemase [Alkaliphilus peptidifermentans]SCY49342.1 alanine racemase [Alkaliphilus peptidifermentans DSM 18978]